MKNYLKNWLDVEKKFFELTGASRSEEWKELYFEIIEKWEEMAKTFDLIDHDFDRSPRNSFGNDMLTHKVTINVLQNIPSLQDVSIVIGYDVSAYRLLSCPKPPKNIGGHLYLYEFTTSDCCD